MIGGKYVEFGAPFEAQKLVDGNWHHVAGSFDGESIRLFVDGKKIGEQAARGKLSQGDSSAAYIGSSGGSTAWFRGGIDDFRICAVKA